MKRFWRTAAALVLALAGAVGAAGTAVAAPQACDPDGGYWAQGVCALTVEASPVCTGTGTPRLEYVATPQGTSSTVLTMTWVNPTGDDVVLTGLPLSGAVDWPSGAWADGAVEVSFAVNPSTAVTVVHPSGASCGVGARAALGATGATPAPLVAGALGLVAVGAAAVVVARRRSAVEA